MIDAYKGEKMSISLDPYDIKILSALEKNGALTNTQLSEIVNLSASQCSRRRIRLEQEAFITSYHARLNNEKIGLILRAVVRVNLNSHSQQNEADFINLIHQHEEIKEAFSVSGDADYVLIMQCRDLASFSEFIHNRLLPKPMIGQVKSEIALKQIKHPF